VCFLSYDSSRFYSKIDEEGITACCPRINLLLKAQNKETDTTLKLKGMMQCVRNRSKDLG